MREWLRKILDTPARHRSRRLRQHNRYLNAKLAIQSKELDELAALVARQQARILAETAQYRHTIKDT